MGFLNCHHWVRRSGLPAYALFLSLAGSELLFAQAIIEGRVVNGTLARPAAGQEVRLLSPGGGMQQISATTTDSGGRFLFTGHDIDPNAFYLVEARFQDISYHAAARFDSTGTATADVTIYESTRVEPALRVQTLRILARAEGTKVRVRTEYVVENLSSPPRAFASEAGTFHFHLSPQAGEPKVSVSGLMNMPLPQEADPGKKPGEFSIRYPLKPGATTIDVDYKADYSPAGTLLDERPFYPVGNAEMYVSPANLAVESRTLKPAGVDSANSIEKFDAQNLAAGAVIEARLTGEPAPLSAAQPGEGEAEVKVLPNSMTRLGVPLLGCFLLILLWALSVRMAKEWPLLRAQSKRNPAQRQLGEKAEALLNSLADLDELFAARKIPESQYWKERLDLKAKLVAILKKSPPSALKSYATRNTAR